MNALPLRFAFTHCSFGFLLMGMTAPAISSATDLRIETKIEENYILEKRVEKPTNILQATETEVRLDVGNQSSFLVDLKTGKLKVLNHKAKIVEDERPGTVIARIGALIRGETPVPPKSWKATGKTEKIAGHECEIYREDVEQLMRTDFWVAATGFEEYAKLSPEVKRAVQVLGNEVIFQASPPCMILKEEGGLKNALMTTKTSTFSFADIPSGTLLKCPPITGQARLYRAFPPMARPRPRDNQLQYSYGIGENSPTPSDPVRTGSRLQYPSAWIY